MGLAMNPLKLFWICDCHKNGKYSLVWQPPDYNVGECVKCHGLYYFDSKWGEDELVKAGGKATAGSVIR